MKDIDIQKRIDEYKDKLAVFKANTKLKELIGMWYIVDDVYSKIIAINMSISIVLFLLLFVWLKFSY